MRDAGRTMRSMAVVVALTTVGLSLAPGVASAATPTRTCDGREATIVSSAATIEGTVGDDVIVASGTTGQTIRAGAGDDIICGSSGPDRIFAGDGDDTVSAGTGNDTIDGSIGVDTLDGGFGRDTISGGSGDDVIAGGPGNDTVAGNTGDDRVTGGGGDDALSGNVGDDVIGGGLGDDRANGGAGDDILAGDGGSDTLTGDIGGDSLDGGLEPDVIDPGEGWNLCGSDTTDSVRGQCAIDRTGVVVSDAVVPRVVTAGSTMTITWRATDAGGVANTTISFGGYIGWVTSWCGFVTVADRVSGNHFDGVYRATCDVPANAVNGSYTVFISAKDSFDNNSAWDSSSQFDFSVVGGSDDASPPAVSDLSARVEGGSVIVRWRATDETGVAGQSAWLALGGYSFANTAGVYFIYNSVALVAGDATDGLYEQRIDRRRFTPNGTYTVWITVVDTLGNKSFTQTSVTFTI